MAIAMPPSVIVLMVAPNARRTRTAAASDSGIAVSVMAAARRLARNSNTMTTTSRPPSRSALDDVVDGDLDEVGLPEDPADRSSCPRGSSCCSASSSRSSRAVSSIVLAPGCFCTPTITAGLPLRDPSPRLNARALAHVRDVADEDRPVAAQRDDALADLLGRPDAADGLEDVLLRTLRCRCRPTCSGSRRGRRRAARSATRCWRAAASGCAMTWNCRSAPPIGVTCDTPGTASSRRRTIVSAIGAQRQRIVVSDEIAKNRISPMIDEIGASTGRSTCGGSVPPTSASFSDDELPRHEDVGAPVELDPDDGDADARSPIGRAARRRRR